MATYRQVYMSFWSDPKIEEDFTPEDRYFYLYLLTNPYTNITGCYEIGYKQMARGTGYNEDTVKRLIERLKTVHQVIDYNEQNKEVLLINWHKYNWSRSDNLLTGVTAAINKIKTPEFRTYLSDVIEGVERVYRGSTDPIQTSVPVTVTDTVPVTKDKKKKYGEYQHVLLKDSEYEKLKEKFPKTYEGKIKEMDEAIELKGYKYKSHYLAILKWAKEDKAEEKSEVSFAEQFRQAAKEAGWNVND